MAERKAGDAAEPTFLRRWSQRKLAAARDAAAPAPAAEVRPDAQPAAPLPATAVSVAPTPEARAAVPDLPPVESLTFDSDFRAFLGPKVEEATRRAALRKLFADPRFNVMDGLDVYIDDYTKFEPIAPDVLKQLGHVRYVLDPPKTRVNEQGYVEDVVDGPAAAEQADANAPADAAALADGAPASPPAEPVAVADAPSSEANPPDAAAATGTTLALPLASPPPHAR